MDDLNRFRETLTQKEKDARCVSEWSDARIAEMVRALTCRLTIMPEEQQFMAVGSISAWKFIYTICKETNADNFRQTVVTNDGEEWEFIANRIKSCS